MTNPSLESRYLGCFLGLACADALGGSVEFRNRADIAREFPNGVREILGGGPHSLEIGEVTDDTSMALAIARACTPGGIDIEAVAANFLAWYRSHPKDIGISTRAALAYLDAGLAWDEAGERLQRESTTGVAGNGSVMRCAPIAMRFRSDRHRLRSFSLDVSRITHADPRATWGSVALNQAIAHLLNGGSIDDLVAAAVTDVDEPRVVQAIRAAQTLGFEDVPSDGFVLDTLTASFWSSLHRDSAEEAIVTAVSMGLDTDTTGAVTGAIVGAAYGIDAIPSRWRSVIHHHDEIETLSRTILKWDQESSRR
jgi:ADP-ribosyl-[dinitrogen reductase] hydrolase